MIQNVSNAAILNAANSKPAANVAVPAPAASNAAKPETTVTAKAVPTVASINAQAFLERQQIGAALYDRSFTLSEGISALTTQKGIAAYAKKAESDGKLTAAELQKLDKKLDKAEVKIQNMTTNNKGADLDSNAAIDGRELDVVQQNLMDRINAGVKDGTLTKEEAEGLLKRQDELNKLEASLRESDGKLTAGEQKQVLDQLRKEADRVNSLRHNNVGVNLTYKTYADSIDARQAALEKQLEAGIKSGTLTEDEAKVVRGYLDDANKLEAEYGADGRIDWKDHNRLSTALNSAEIQLYDLQRNDSGKKLKASYVDVVHVDKREAQQLESIARGISNKSLTDEEAIATLEAQKGIQGMEDGFIKDGDGKLDRGEYLRLQSAMNTFDLANHEAQTNSARWNGILSEPKVAAQPKPAAPVAPVAPAATPVVTADVKPVVAPVAPVVTSPVEQVRSETKSETQPTTAQINRELADDGDHFADMMVKAMKEQSDNFQKVHDELSGSAEKARSERESNDNQVKREAAPSVWVPENKGLDLHGNAEVGQKVAAYAAAAASIAQGQPPIAKKVA